MRSFAASAQFPECHAIDETFNLIGQLGIDEWNNVVAIDLTQMSDMKVEKRPWTRRGCRFRR
jgi:hypothetical protein